MLCLTVNLMIGTYNGEMVFNRLLGNGWSILDDFPLRNIFISTKVHGQIGQCTYETDDD